MAEVDVSGIESLDSLDISYGGPIGAHLQGKVDRAHSNNLYAHSQNIARVNFELRHIIQDLKAEFTKKIHDPDQDWPCDLTDLEGKFQQFREIYNKYMIECGDTPQGEPTKGLLHDPFSGDLTDVSKADLEKIVRKIEDVESSHKDSVTETTQQLYLLGQLYITITDILRKMDEGQRRFMERIAERSGMR